VASIARKGRSRLRAPTSDLATVRLLVDDIAAGIRVLQSRDGVPVSNDQILERARNIVTALIGNYRIHSVEAKPRREEAANGIGQLDLLEHFEDDLEDRLDDRLDDRFDEDFAQSSVAKTARA
jgi:hypothetical protein